ncbi:MAG: Cadherin protein, partial [Planctomycetaceae bacterium]|nr:Cadherin protein [Planctomycetaceae bacterium]
PDSFTFTDNDGNIDSAPATIILQVNAINLPPVFTSSSALSVAENTTSVITVHATDPDLPPQTVTYSITGGVDQSQFGITPNGVLSFKTAPHFETPSDSDKNNIYLVQVTADDGHGGLTVQSLSITVTSVVQSPVIWTKKQPAVKLLPTAGVAVSNFAGGSLTVNATASGNAKKTVDLFSFPAATALGTITTSKYANGQLAFSIQFSQNVTASAIQNFLRGITFSTKGAGLNSPTRTFSVTLVNSSGHSSTVSNTIDVKKKP